MKVIAAAMLLWVSAHSVPDLESRVFSVRDNPGDSASLLDAWDAEETQLLSPEDSATALGPGIQENRPQVSWLSVDRLHTLSFQLARPTSVRARVLDVLGQPVRTLALGLLAPGRRKVQWDGRDSVGRIAAGGRYVIELRLGPLTFHKSVAHSP